MADLANRRSFVRKQIDIAVHVVQVLSPSGKNKTVEGHVFVARDLSPQGMSVETDMKLRTGYALRLEFVLAGESRKVRLDAKIKRVIPAGKLYPSTHPLYALQFIRLSPAVQTYLTNYLTGTFLLV